MDPVTALGALAAIAQITGNIFTLTEKVHRCIKGIRSAPKEVKYFFKEVSLFAGQVDMFSEKAEEFNKRLGKRWDKRFAKNCKIIKAQYEIIEEHIEHFVDRFITIHEHNDTRARLIWARFLWTLARPDIQGLYLLINSTKANAMIYTLFLMLEETLQKGAADNDPKIRKLQDMVRSLQRIERQARRDLSKFAEIQGLRGLFFSDGDEIVFLEGSQTIENFIKKSVRQEFRRVHESRRYNTETQDNGNEVSPSARPKGSPRSSELHASSNTSAASTVGQGSSPIANWPGSCARANAGKGTEPASRTSRQSHTSLAESTGSKISPRVETSRGPPTESSGGRTQRRTFDNILRDDGTKVSEYRGFWHPDSQKDDNDNEDATISTAPRHTNNTTATGTESRRSSRTRDSRVEGRAGGSSGSSVRELRATPSSLVSPEKTETQAESSSTAANAKRQDHKHLKSDRASSRSDESHRWKPVPPFGGPGDRKRPKLPRSSSPSVEAP
ncbi:hypothetical protein BX600DRAFT_548270 [Xylariales sp. PMI_506]|nr:hypothetical protein BX600DRAFT_548270 [Xylariales sp. PMI_506]